MIIGRTKSGEYGWFGNRSYFSVFVSDGFAITRNVVVLTYHSFVSSVPFWPYFGKCMVNLNLFSLIAMPIVSFAWFQQLVVQDCFLRTPAKRRPLSSFRKDLVFSLDVDTLPGENLDFLGF